jgi:hypothetical protein
VDARLRDGDYVLVKEKIAVKEQNLAPTFGLDVFKVMEIHSDVSILVRRCTSRGAVGGSTKRTMLVNIGDLRRLACDADPSESQIARVHDHHDVAGGREYLIEFPGLGDKRQFRWETEADLLQTPGNDAPLVAYDMLRKAERRVAFVPDRFNEDAPEDAPEEEVAEEEVAPVRRKFGRPKKVLVAAGAGNAAAAPAPASTPAPKSAVAAVAPAPPAARPAARPARVRQPSRKLQEAGTIGGVDENVDADSD